jgi:hypothetical protein
MFGRKRLTQSRKRTGAAIAAEAWPKCNGDEDLFLSLVKDDKRLVGIDPALIILMIQLMMAIFQYFKNRNTSAPSDESMDEIIVNSVRYLGE